MSAFDKILYAAFIVLVSVSMALVFLLGASNAAFPSDLISYQDAPGKMSLQHVSPASARAIDGLNEPLGKYVPWEVPNIGRLASWAIREAQSNEPTETALANFSQAEPMDLKNTSVGGTEGNFTVINSTMVWL